MRWSTRGSKSRPKDWGFIVRIALGVAALGAVMVMAVFAPLMAHFAPDEMDIVQRLAPPSVEHWLGCDINGADIWTSLLYGARTSLYVGFLTVFCSMTLGVTIGLVAGYRGGWIDAVLMRSIELIMAFPGILLAMAVTALLGPSVHNVIIAITITGWASSARLVRGQALSLRERDFVTAVRALGASDFRILLRHMLPGVISPLVVHGTFSLSGVIIVEASLSFLGLGAQDGSPTWGALLSQGRAVMSEAPHVAIVPGVALMVLILGLNFLGDGLRDKLDPRNAVRR